MAEGDVSFSTQSQWNVIYEFASPALRPYKQRSKDRLAFILDQLELSSEANLGYTKVTWLPDNVVRIRYLAMEGILQPIIVVRVEFQESFLQIFDEELARNAELERLEEEEEDDDETYRPFAWIGIRAVQHEKPNIAEDNPSCAFWGFPVDPHLVGFDPRPLGQNQVDYDYTKTCESFPVQYMFGTAFARLWTGHNADLQRFFRIRSTLDDEVFNDFANDQGTFQWQDWTMYYDGEVSASHSNMVLLELLDVRVTEPDAAIGWNAKRAIVIAPQGLNFPGSPGSNGTRTAVIEMGGGADVTHTATYEGGSIFSTLLTGEYEIHAFSTTFSCECTQAVVEIRVILGEFGGRQMVYDFTVPNIGNPPALNTKFYFRDVILGGYQNCRADVDNAFGPCDHGEGWSPTSIFVDVEKGTVRQASSTIFEPHFNQGCGPTTKVGPKHPACVGCTGVTTEQPANTLDYPSAPFLTYDAQNAGETAFDLRGGVLWHLARVAQVDNVTGYVCRVILVGDDGGQGDCGDCKSFSYGTNMPAIGVSENIPIGSDLRDFPDSGQTSYRVGELVVVIGWTNPLSETCQVLPGDWFLIVTRTEGGHDEEFRNLYWSQFRCGKAGPVETFFRKVENVFKRRSDCSGGPLTVKCECKSGRLTCTKPELPAAPPDDPTPPVP